MSSVGAATAMAAKVASATKNCILNIGYEKILLVFGGG